MELHRIQTRGGTLHFFTWKQQGNSSQPSANGKPNQQWIRRGWTWKPLSQQSMLRKTSKTSYQWNTSKSTQCKNKQRQQSHRSAHVTDGNTPEDHDQGNERNDAPTEREQHSNSQRNSQNPIVSAWRLDWIKSKLVYISTSLSDVTPPQSTMWCKAVNAE